MTDIIGQPTKVTRERGCTAFGAAILGAFGSGAFSSIDEAVGAMVNVEGEFEPNEAHRELHAEQYGVYRGMYEAIANGGQYQRLPEFSTRHF
jgi:sugar (pentulose or hexulose) kinase